MSQTGSFLVAKATSKHNKRFSALTHTENLEEHYVLFVKCWMFRLRFKTSNDGTNRNNNLLLKEHLPKPSCTLVR